MKHLNGDENVKNQISLELNYNKPEISKKKTIIFYQPK